MDEPYAPQAIQRNLRNIQEYIPSKLPTLISEFELVADINISRKQPEVNVYMPQIIPENQRDERGITDYIPSTLPTWISEFKRTYDELTNEEINSILFSSPIPKTPVEGCNSIEDKVN